MHELDVLCTRNTLKALVRRSMGPILYILTKEIEEQGRIREEVVTHGLSHL